MSYSLNELAIHLDAEVVGDGEVRVTKVGTLQSATAGQIAFLSNSKYRKFLTETQASAVLLDKNEAEHCPVPALVHKNPYLAFALLAQLLDQTPRVAEDIATTACIDPSASLGKNVCIGANAVIDKDVTLGDNVQIGAGCYVGRGTSIGADTKLYPNVTVYHDIQIGKSVTVQSGTVIGSDGFGYANDRGRWIKIPQSGRVIIGDETEIGAGVAIDRGALDDTIIGKNVIIDNLCQIAHNCVIGDHSCMAGTAALAGSVEMGKYVILGGGAGVNGHIQICDKAQVTGFSMITRSITEPGLYSSGVPATSNKEWRRSMVRLRQLDELFDKVKTLSKEIKALKEPTDQ